MADTNTDTASAATTHQRYSVNAFADACRECGEEWPCRETLKAQVETLRGAVEDALLDLAGGREYDAEAVLRRAADSSPT